MNTRGNIALLLTVVLIPLFAGVLSIIGILSRGNVLVEETKIMAETKLETTHINPSGSSVKTSQNEILDKSMMEKITPKMIESYDKSEENKIQIPGLSKNEIKKKKKQQSKKVLEDIKIAKITSNEKFIGYATRHSDLKNQTEVSADDIDYIIDTVLNGRQSKLHGCGQALITASQKTGLSPVFLLSLTAAEAGWVVNPGHARKNNPYSVNMTNTGGTATGYVFGNDYSSGLINGAIWINHKYYEQGQTSLHKFIYGKKSYCVPGEGWINAVTSIMNRCYRILDSRNPKSA